MHLLEFLRARNRTCAGLYFAITRKCPLSCAHCCSASSMDSEEFSGDPFLRLVGTMTNKSRPDFLLITGGEPLLRPALVSAIATKAQALGIKVVLASGLFFATARETSKSIQNALGLVDHITISLDQYHEREVPRSAVFQVAESLLRRGIEVSFQIVGWSEKDPYLKVTTDAIVAAFGDRIPALIVPIGAMGRGSSLFDQNCTEEPPLDEPCISATWPVVTYDGTIVACCSQDVVDRPRPPHLTIGHAATDDWETVRERMLSRTALRAIRIFGPVAVARKLDPDDKCDGYCSNCTNLSAKPELERVAGEMVSGAAVRSLERIVQETDLDTTRFNLSGYEHWSERGYKSGTSR
jgi:hypothetical protein